MNIQYLNTDLELESATDLMPIIKAFGDDAYNLHNGGRRGHFLATFEVVGLVGDSPDSVIQHFCMLIDAFDDKEKAIWDGCYRRTFDIGYEGGSTHNSYTDEIRAETLQRISALDVSLRITVYPMDGTTASCRDVTCNV